MKFRTFVTAGCLLFISPAFAAVSVDEAAKLGTTLTPVGAEKAGNADGTIPEWTGGLTKSPSGFKPGGSYVDPFPEDKPLFTIDAKNVDQHKSKLTPGQLAMLKRYPSFKMPVYQSRRSAAFPQGLYAETKANATKVNLVEGGNGFEGTTGGFAFPIPKSGLEIIWNHLTAYKGDTYATAYNQAAVTANGDYNLVHFELELHYNYNNQKIKPENRDPDLLLYFLQVVTAPTRLAGGVLLVHDYTNQVKDARKAWTYNPGQRRVRLAPNVSYDNPGTAADGLRTNDDLNQFNGATDRYDWKLLGKQEIYIPYNAYRIASPSLKIRDLLKPGHVGTDHARYELHRVWVVEANLKPGTSHVYKRRVFFIDEDSWIVHLQDKYDNRGQLWRFDELHSAQSYDVPFLGTSLEVKYDLLSGRYLALNIRNEDSKVYQPITRTDADFSPAALRGKGTR